MQTLRDTFASLTTPQRWWLGGGAAALFVLILVLIIVSGPADEPEVTTTTTTPPETTSSTSTSTSSTSTTATTVSGAELWPLTGLPVTEGAPTDPILAVKIDNTANSRPQAGLEFADLVFDIPVEGGVSRLLAFFQSQLPQEIGPVRSVREVDPKLLTPFGALIAYSGGQPAVVAAVRDVAVDIGDPVLGSGAYRRAADRPAPYDLMLDPYAALASVEDALGAAGPWLSFSERPVGEPTPARDPALNVEINASIRHQVVYGYSATDGGYLRFHRSAPHLVASEDEIDIQIVATNVIVLVVEQLETGRTDSSGAPVPDFDVLGTGEVVVFRDGAAQVGRWERGRLTDFFRFFDQAGREIRLAPGTTWIHLVPEGRSFEWR
jgi:hypothetical protein